MPTNRRSFLKSAVALPLLAQTQFSKVALPSPFKIDFSREALADLQRRIEQGRWPRAGYEAGWTAGVHLGVLKDLVTYWLEEFDWFAVQGQLNELSHFKLPVAGEGMHFVRYTPQGEARPFPLLLLHGWPSSFMEFAEGAPLLSSKGFEVIVPSLPGFTFSQAPGAPGMHPAKMAERMHQLMTALGFGRYGVQGGDWGSVIAGDMGKLYPESVAGVHLDSVWGEPLPEGEEPSRAEQDFHKTREAFNRDEIAYFRLQGTKPQSLAVGLADSPVGLLAWMLEKYWAWSDHSGDLWEAFDREWVLTSVSLYWLTNSILSSMGVYYHYYHTYQKEAPKGPIQVPIGYGHFPKNPWSTIEEIARRNPNLKRYTAMPEGGHFPAVEQTELWAEDVGAFFSDL